MSPKRKRKPRPKFRRTHSLRITVSAARDRLLKGLWLIRGHGIRGSNVRGRRKAEEVAYAFARQLVANEPGLVVSVRTRNLNGEYGTERTFPRAGDPKRSKG